MRPASSQCSEIVVVDRAVTKEEADDLTRRLDQMLKVTGKDVEFEAIDPVKHRAGHNTHWKVRMVNLKVKAERKAREAEEKKRQRELRKAEASRRRSEAMKGKPLPERAGRQAVLYRALGKSMTIQQWAEASGINERTLRTRLRNGLSMQEAVTRPLWKR